MFAHPCGQWVDWIWYCYKLPMRTGHGVPPVEVQWYPAPAGAKVVDVPHIFGSRWWEEEQDNDGLGEQWPSGFTRQRRRAKYGFCFPTTVLCQPSPVGYTGQSRCGSDQVWQQGGLIDRDPLLTLDAVGFAPCCGEVEIMTMIIRHDGVDVAVVPALNFESCPGVDLTVGWDPAHSAVDVKVCVDDTLPLIRTVTDNATFGTTLLAQFRHLTTAVPANGIGLFHEIQVDTDTGVVGENIAPVLHSTYYQWQDATFATRKPSVIYQLHGSSLTQGYFGARLGAADAVIIGWFGVAGAGQQSGDVITGLKAFGLFTGSPTLNGADLTDTSVTPAKMNNGTALSVLGRAAPTAGVRADIAATEADGDALLVYRSGDVEVKWINALALGQGLLYVDTEFASLSGAAARGVIGVNESAPASASAAGEAGQFAYDSSWLYVCIATDTWKRVALSTW